MDSEESKETKVCENCKREIPAGNYTIHTVHCARNIKVCPVCKEPVPHSELVEHHEKLHKLLPCKECGESVCGTDMADHIRDSCAHTMKTCRFCALELRRGAMPAHERYCGARTERCADCGEWVMLRYRQLHLDSNHGFIRLTDDPEPTPSDVKLPTPIQLKEPKTITVNGITRKIDDNRNIPRANVNVNQRTHAMVQVPTSSNIGMVHSKIQDAVIKPTNVIKSSQNVPKNANIPRESEEQIIRSIITSATNSRMALQPECNGVTNTNIERRKNIIKPSSGSDGASSSGSANGAIPRSKRSNDQPQVNTAAAAPDKVKKNMWSSGGAVKKRPAPRPPADPGRELALGSALQRQQAEQLQRQEQTARNLAQGLPPVLSAAEKIEKLRKMDALQNRETDNQDYKNKLQGRVWMTPNVPAGNVLGSARDTREAPRDRQRQILDVDERQREDLKNLKPMSPEEFMDRFNELQLRKDSNEVPPRTGDRFSQIKSSLQELRRGLNEVTAPYNINLANENSYGEGGRAFAAEPWGRADVEADADELGLDELWAEAEGAAADPWAAAGAGADADAEDVALPCEFCDAPVPLHDLVRHQTGCRPDLAQLIPKPTNEAYRGAVPRVPRAASPRHGAPRAGSPRHRAPRGASPRRGAPRGASPRHGGQRAAAPRDEAPRVAPYSEPVIPCEFCAESLPVYLINEHQERCGRESNLLFAD